MRKHPQSRRTRLPRPRTAVAAVCGFLAFARFNGGGMLSQSLEGVDREALYEAVSTQ